MEANKSHKHTNHLATELLIPNLTSVLTNSNNYLSNLIKFSSRSSNSLLVNNRIRLLDTPRKEIQLVLVLINSNKKDASLPMLNKKEMMKVLEANSPCVKRLKLSQIELTYMILGKLMQCELEQSKTIQIKNNSKVLSHLPGTVMEMNYT
jgi:hypothetical protein